MDIYQRFMDLPRGRKGDKTVVIVEEAELAKLIAMAQTSEALLFGAREAKVGTHRSAPGFTQINVTTSPDLPRVPTEVVSKVVEDALSTARRMRGGRR